MITFSLPWAFIGLLSLPLLILFYMLRTRFKPRTVSSLMFFEHITSVPNTGRRLTRLQPTALFLLELLILLMLVMAAAGPGVRHSQNDTPLVIILDDSLSMQATTHGQSSRDRGLARLRTKLTGQTHAPLHLIFAGTGVTINKQVSPEKLNEALAGWRCSAAHADLAAALAEAQKIVPLDTQIIVISDRKPSMAITHRKIHWIAAGRPTANLAIVNAVRSSRKGRRNCLLEVANFSDQPVQSPLQINGNSQTLALKPWGRKRLWFNLPPASGVFSAELPADALLADNHITLLPQVERKVKTAIHTNDKRLNQTIRAAVEASGLALVAPQWAPDTQLVFNSSTTASLENAWQVSIVCDHDAASYNGPYVADYNHPLFQGLSLEGVIWGTGLKGTIPGVPILSIGNITVLTEQTAPDGTRRIHCRFNPQRSTLQQTPAWPIFFWNLLKWRQEHLPGLPAANFRIGRPVMFNTGPATQEPYSWELISPDGRRHNLPVGATTIPITPDMPGIYHLRNTAVNQFQKNSPENENQLQFAANYLDDDESDLSQTASGAWGRWEPGRSVHQGVYPLAWLFLLTALLLMMIHSLLIQPARKGVAH